VGLWHIFLTKQDRSVRKMTSYFPAYEQHLARFVNRPAFLLEIGVSDGGSLQMWKQYLGPFARVVGVDVREGCAFAEDQIEVRIGDQSNQTFLQSILDEFGAPDIVVDDGSHLMPHTTAAFEYLYPRMAPNGVYAVEDMHTAYAENYGGGLGSPASFIEIAKGLVDDLNAQTAPRIVEPSEFTRSTLSIHFYPSMVIFERGRVVNSSSPRYPAKWRDDHTTLLKRLPLDRIPGTSTRARAKGRKNPPPLIT
jgi:hypothetical protein